MYSVPNGLPSSLARSASYFAHTHAHNAVACSLSLSAVPVAEVRTLFHRRNDARVRVAYMCYYHLARVNYNHRARGGREEISRAARVEISEIRWRRVGLLQPPQSARLLFALITKTRGNNDLNASGAPCRVIRQRKCDCPCAFVCLSERYPTDSR